MPGASTSAEGKKEVNKLINKQLNNSDNIRGKIAVKEFVLHMLTLILL